MVRDQFITRPEDAAAAHASIAAADALKAPRDPRSLVEQMADKIREIAMNGTAVTADVLYEHSDFTRAEIDEHGREAADLARRHAVRRLHAAA